ncbi:AEC family transporter [Sporosarcina thermotolerans]|uniref:AEC family transporter n=1 Tax=Sporosarcina thermotolerans TaxID=633404 RepID=A0AAW9ABQ6_9BACL|nr:AEC family transporter [Sporosarcina thermotolerans]MDW0116591.1 AEC family transporter [Sporosarcina thermotolerans]
MFIGTIFINIIIPILILLLVGAGLQRKFAFNLKAISNLITYCLMPAAVFINLYQTEIDVQILLEIIGYLVAFSLIIIVVTTVLSKLLKLERGEAAIFKNSISLINSGNYGIPVSQLLFHANPLGISIQIIVMVFQNILTYTYGLYNLISATKSGLEILKSLLKMPVIHAMLLGGLLNWLQIPIPSFLWTPISHLAGAFLAIALVLLGAQLAQIELKTIVNRTIVTSSIGRLIIGPSVALLLIFIFGIDGVVAQSLFIASSFPTSRNSSTLALEYDVHPDLAAQTVLFSTVLSAITVTFVVYLSTVLFV